MRVYIYIYIYIYMRVCVWMCVGGSLCVVGGLQNYHQYLWSSAGGSRETPFVYFGTKTTQRVVSAWTCGTGRKNVGCWSVRSETPNQIVRRFLSWTQNLSVGFKTWVKSSRRVVWSQERRHRSLKTMNQKSQNFGISV